jgi:ketosteroid isomerase-like protein
MEKLDNKEFRRIVDAMNRRYDDCLNNKTPQRYPDLVTDKYVWVDEDKPIEVRGKAGVLKLGTEWVEMGVTNEKITAVEVENYGSSGWQIAEIVVDFPNEKGELVRTKGRFVEIFEKEVDGQWRTRLQFFLPFK